MRIFLFSPPDSENLQSETLWIVVGNNNPKPSISVIGQIVFFHKSAD
jgi:hypothetical protein